MCGRTGLGTRGHLWKGKETSGYGSVHLPSQPRCSAFTAPCAVSLVVNPFQIPRSVPCGLLAALG